ncbi:MAG: protoporphyrinogen oxidase [Deltaproteobacteria bacterium]|nr:protoporphyrinogen oxidase [Deltaproteobacteria bacterium]
MKKVVIIGGGVSGMAIAYALTRQGMTESDVAVFEKASRPGGNVQTDLVDGYTIEQGPNGFLDNVPATLSLVNDLGIDHVLPSNRNAARRFIWRDGKLREIKANPVAFLSSGVLPLSGALRVAMEPFQKRGRDDAESVFDFAARRIGKSAAEYLVAAMVQGAFAGDARRIELKSAFPKMYAMEKQDGALVKAMMAKSRKKKQGGGPAGPGGKRTSFDEGMHTLPAALASKLGDIIKLNAGVSSLAWVGDRFVVTLENGDFAEAASVVMANPAWSAATQLDGLNAQLAHELGAITYPPVLVVATGFNTGDLAEAPNGFGFLVPRHQGVRALGCLWSSSVWKYRAPEGRTLFRTMLGGSVDPDAAQLSDDEAIATVLDDLKKTMGVTAVPELTRVYRYKRAIAQYEVGHSARVRRIEELFSTVPGLYLSGSSYGGISVNHCIEEAPGVAAAILRFLRE